MRAPGELPPLITRDFARHLAKTRYNGRYLATNLTKIFRNWVSQPHWRHEFGIDGLQPHEWVELEQSILGPIRARWQSKSAVTRKANATRKAKALDSSRQLKMQL